MSAAWKGGVVLQNPNRLCLWLAIVLLHTAAGISRADETNDLREEIKSLQQQNTTLLEELRRQQTQINDLNRTVSAIKDSSEPQTPDAADAAATAGFNFGKVHLSGEGGVGLFTSGPEGIAPNSSFRVDEARLFLDAPIWGDVYAHTELDLAQRESDSIFARLEEFYLEFDDVPKLWGSDLSLNLRVGRMDIPFGEEYQNRFAIDDPLISHSVSDIWGVDDGVELYGSAGKFSYVLAVQNGGYPDYSADKSVIGRLSFDPTPVLHLSLSAMRTGDLDASEDEYSALWFGNSMFDVLDDDATSKFGAELVEGDVALRLKRDRLRAFGGYLHYHDNDPAGNNHRDIYYYALEAEHRFASRFYVAGRFSQVFAPDGFPLPGNGDYDEYSEPFTAELWRLSLGVGYRFSENLLIKSEYSLEGGHTSDGEQRDRENLFAAEAAFRF